MMELIRTSECDLADRKSKSRLGYEIDIEPSLSAAVVGNELVVSQVEAYGCRGMIDFRGKCSSPCLSGSTYTVYLIRVRWKGRQWIVRRRFREFIEINDLIVDKELHAIFPPRSLWAKAGLACVLETRQSRLAYYVNELAHKVVNEPRKRDILVFFQAVDSSTCELETVSLSFSHNEKGERGSSVEAGMRTDVRIQAPAAGNFLLGTSDRLSLPASFLAQEKAALDRLMLTLKKGICVIKHGRRGVPKKRLIFCNEDCTRLYWASDRNQGKHRNLSSLAITDLRDVRESTAPDPEHPGLLGTATLRRRCSSAILPVLLATAGNHPGQQPIPRAFSLITTARSLDLEALTAEEFTLLVDGFRAALRHNVSGQLILRGEGEYGTPQNCRN